MRIKQPVIVDSCGWLEYFADSINSSNFAPVIENIESLIVPTICLHEVFKVVLRERNESNAIEVVAAMLQGNVIQLSEEISLLSAKLSYELKIPTADSIILATGELHNAIIYTQDAHFKNLSNVKYFDKK